MDWGLTPTKGTVTHEELFYDSVPIPKPPRVPKKDARTAMCAHAATIFLFPGFARMGRLVTKINVNRSLGFLHTVA